MKQSLHLFKKDLRRGWPLLLLWAAVLGVQAIPVWQEPLDAEDFGQNTGGIELLYVTIDREATKRPVESRNEQAITLPADR